MAEKDIREHTLLDYKDILDPGGFPASDAQDW